MKKVIFICVHNSARSQMAEEYLKKMASDSFIVESAGFEPSSINPYVKKAMLEEGIDLTHKETKDVIDVFKKNDFIGETIIVTVCDRARELDCPVYPGIHTRLHWDLEDPSKFTGTEQEILIQVKETRDQIKQLVADFIPQYK